MEEYIINGVKYKFVTLRGRSKLIAEDGSALNPYHRKQKATIHMNPDGYPCFGGGVPVHLYVATAWVPGYFDGAEVDHKDYDRTNYHADNLRWVTHQDNVKHSAGEINHYIGKHAGVANGRSMFTEDDVATIRKMFDDGMSTADVIKVFYPTYSAKQRRSVWNRFNRIKTGETWN